jgi:hypothetical protein
MIRKILLTVAAVAGLEACPGASLAQLPLPLPLPLPMEGTPEDRAACAPSVHAFCEAALPDTMRVLACLQQNRERIAPACRAVLVKYGQ